MIFQKLRDVKSPERANITDSGIDFYIPNDLEYVEDSMGTHWSIIGSEILVPGRSNIKIPLGVKIKLDEGYDLTFFNKSGITSKTGLIVGACVIDNGYRGELVLNLINTSNVPVSLKLGQKIVQGIVRKCEYGIPVEGVIDDTTDRGEGGFGSTGL